MMGRKPVVWSNRLRLRETYILDFSFTSMGRPIGLGESAEIKAKRSAVLIGNTRSVGYKQTPEHIAKRTVGRKHTQKEKCCPKCGERDLSQFSKNKARYDGLQSHCRACSNLSNPALRYAQHGLTLDEYSAIIVAQNNVCGMCGKPFDDNRAPCIDHNHACCAGTHGCKKCVRGVIHGRCNILLGLANDDPEVLWRAAAYISHHPL